MRTYHSQSFRRKTRSSRRGVIIVFVALLLPLIMFVAASAVDLAFLRSARTELQNTADATAKAAIVTYINTGDVAKARAAAQEIAERNYVAGQTFRLDAEDVEFGVATNSDVGFAFTENETEPNAVRVFARRTADSAAGPISLFFGKSFGHVNVELVRASMARVSQKDVVVILDRGRTMAFGFKENSQNPTPTTITGRPWNWCSPVKFNSRFMVALLAIENKLQDLEAHGSQTRVALVSFGSTARLDQEFTQDYNLIRAKLRAMANAYCEEQVEPMAAAIDLAKLLGISYESTMSAQGRQVSALLLTDDGNQVGNPIVAAASSLGAGIPVSVISLTPETDITRMDGVAAAGGGVHLHAGLESELLTLLLNLLAKVKDTLLVDDNNPSYP